jgi:selenide, water dikinase
VLRHLTPPQDPNLLSGFAGNRDAAVYRLTPDLAIVQTVDYITPILDDPEAFGAIAAANALSDIYAMGGRPVLALNLVGFPVKTLPIGILEAILRGGEAKLAEAGVTLGGGHSIEDMEPKYGLAVTGLVDPQRVITNAGAQAGDILILTKPLGSGIITTGIDRGLVRDDTIARITRLMAQLNRAASETMLAVGVHACTDVSGFGLLGHLRELTAASGVAASVSARLVPIVPEAWDLARQGAIPDGSHNNARYLAQFVDWAAGISAEAQAILCDAQTSGGLLIAVPAGKEADLLLRLQEAGVAATAIGAIVPGAPGKIAVTP